MEQKLLNSVLNGNIAMEKFLDWLLKRNIVEDEILQRISSFGVVQSDFLAYFLNYVHEDMPCLPIDKVCARQKIMRKSDSVKEKVVRLNRRLETSDYLNISASCSTPTIKKSSNSFCSPISPLAYEEKKNRCFERPSPIRLADFVAREMSSEKSPTNGTYSRRINPTVVVKKLNCSFKTENSFDFQENSNEIGEEMSDLMEEKIKILMDKSFENSNILKEHDIKPKINKVTNKCALNFVAQIYVEILNNNFVLNVASEIYFLISLLLSKSYSNINVKSDGLSVCASDLFKNIHNVVYFCVQCLRNLVNIVKFYEKTSLRLLSDNSRLKTFCPDLSHKLAHISDCKPDQVVHAKQWNEKTVCFDLDTDNRENFPDEPTFHAFRKQRDLFYEVLRQHGQPGFPFSAKVRAIFVLSADQANYVHFCRLFKRQLLETGDSGVLTEAGPKGATAAAGAAPPFTDDDEKMRRLRRRLVTPGTAAAAPDFFRAFAEAAPPQFRHHLADAVADHLQRKAARLDAEVDAADPNTKQSFLENLKLLRILARFLGFLEAFPYKSQQFYSEKLLPTYVELRKWSKCRVDIRNVLENSIKRRNLIVTLPWIVEYLQELDYVALRTPYYSDMVRQLVVIYKSFKGAQINVVIIKFVLGKFFEMPQFPEGEFYKFNDEIDLSKPPTNAMDSKVPFDEHSLYVFCPYLEETKKLLLSNNSANKATVRHITPVTAVPSSQEIAKRKLEQKFLENFFNGQPVSTRKTVEFISERVASICVKHICNTLVPQAKRRCVEDSKVSDGKASNLPSRHLDKLVKKCESEIESIILEKVSVCLANLLPLDALPQTLRVCGEISKKSCKERVRRWMECQLTEALFVRELENFSEKKSKEDKLVFALPPTGKCLEHDESFPSGFKLLQQLQEFSVEILDHAENITETKIIDILEKTSGSFSKRIDVNETVTGNACSTLIDISFLLVTYCSGDFSKGAMETFADVLRLFPKSGSLFGSVFCPRNIRLLRQKESWESLADFMAFLVNEKLIEAENFESQCSDFYRTEWEEGVFIQFSVFLKDFIKYHRTYGGDVDKFVLLELFLSEFCGDL